MSRFALLALTCALTGCVATREVPVTVEHYVKQQLDPALLDCGPEPRPPGLADRQIADQMAAVTTWGRECANRVGKIRGLVETK